MLNINCISFFETQARFFGTPFLLLLFQKRQRAVRNLLKEVVNSKSIENLISFLFQYLKPKESFWGTDPGNKGQLMMKSSPAKLVYIIRMI